MRNRIDSEPAVIAREICRMIEGNIPTAIQIEGLSKQLLERHAMCRLEPVVSSEEILEGYYRCVTAAGLATRHQLSSTALAQSISSSHQAVRRVCFEPEQHTYTAVDDAAWTAGWASMQDRNPEVNIRVVGRRSAKHADLYVVAGDRVVSLEFKYVGRDGLRDPAACAAQVRGHAEHHAEAILILYSGNGVRLNDSVIQQLHDLIGVANVRIANVSGLPIPVVGQARTRQRRVAGARSVISRS